MLRPCGLLFIAEYLSSIETLKNRIRGALSLSRLECLTKRSLAGLNEAAPGRGFVQLLHGVVIKAEWLGRLSKMGVGSERAQLS